MIVWSDGESVITHPAKCRCGFCRLDRIGYQYALKKVGLWGGYPYKSNRHESQRATRQRSSDL